MQNAVTFGGERDGRYVGGYFGVRRMGCGHRTPLKSKYKVVLYAEDAKGKKSAEEDASEQ
jgi:hypothetical protein